MPALGRLLPRLSLCLLAATNPALAQKQDQKMLDRVMAKPDMELINPMQNKPFREGGTFTATGETRGLAASSEARRVFPTSEARVTRSFLGIKNPWFGRMVYPTSPAARRDKSFAVRDVTVATAPTRPYADAAKSERQASEKVPTRPFLGRGGAQGSMDLLSEAARRELSADELRELLNKPR